MSKLKEYDIPEEVNDLFIQAAASKECRDKCLGRPFSKRKAQWFAFEYVRLRRKAWAEFYKTYPELPVDDYTWVFDTGKVVEKPSA